MILQEEEDEGLVECQEWGALLQWPWGGGVIGCREERH